MISFSDLTAALETAWREHTRRTKGRLPRQGPRDYLTASNLSECPRAMALDLLHPEDAPPFDDDTLERFYRGDDMEATKNARLHQVGLVSMPPFRVHSQQREVEIFDRAGETLLIRGRVEGTLEFHTIGESLDYEIKSGRAVEHVDSLEDLLRGTWTRKYVRQFLAYLYAQVRGGRGNGRGVFILDRPGLPGFVPLDLAEDDRLLELAESTLQNAEAAVAARFGRPLPDVTTDQSLCRRCYHLGRSCHPPMDFGPGAQVDDDEDAAAMVRQYLDTQEAAQLHERAERYLFGDAKKPGRYRGKPLVLVGGEHIVEGAWGSYTRYEVPDAIKQQYKTVDEQGSWKKTVTRLASKAQD